jgi:hypothetical protein
MSAPIYIVIPEAEFLGATQYIKPENIVRLTQFEAICNVMFSENGKVYKIKTLLTASEIHEKLQEIEEMQRYSSMVSLFGGDYGGERGEGGEDE